MHARQLAVLYILRIARCDSLRTEKRPPQIAQEARSQPDPYAAISRLAPFVVLEHALEGAREKDWPLLEQAVDQKIEEQAEFVRWWKEIVTPNKGGDRRSDQSRGSVTLIADQAEELTGIAQQHSWQRQESK